MNEKNLFRRTLCLFLLLSMLLGYLPTGVLQAKAQESTTFSTEESAPALKSAGNSVTDLGENESLVPTHPAIAGHYQLAVNPVSSRNSVAYTYMSCMTVVNSHAYYIRTTEDRTKALMVRTSLNSRASVVLKVDGAESVTTFGSAKSLDAVTIGGKHYLFLATGLTGADSIRLLQTPDGEAVTTKASFAVQAEDGASLGVDRLTIQSSEGNNVTLLFRCAWKFYTVTIDVTSSGSTLTAAFAFGLDSTATTQMAKTVAGIPESYPVDTVGQVNLTGMDYCREQDRLYISAIVDCCSVVLVYPRVSELITSGTTAAQVNSKLCIRASGSGYETYRIQDLAIEKGVIYYCDRARWVTSTNYRGDICHFINTTTARYDIIESFRETGNYLICGTNNQDEVLFNPTATDGHLNIVDKTTLAEEELRNAYFALESDRQGYWYIRSLSRGYNLGDVTDNSLVSKYYITLAEDGSVTLAPKESGNSRQLWFIRYAGMSGNIKLFAIQNKETGLYLNNLDENGVYPVVANDSGKTFVLQQQKVCADPDPTRTLENLLFDYTFYTSAYSEAAGMTEAEAKDHYNTTGKAAGYMPGPFFDPTYYRAHNTDLKGTSFDSNEGAYNHFIKHGFWEGRQGSVFFSVSEYYSRGKSQDIRNLYSVDKVLVLYHFKNYGIGNNATKDHRAGSDEFDLKEFSEEFKLIFEEAESYSVLRDYVAGLVRLKNCTTQAELEALLFDSTVYSKDPALSEEKVAGIAGSTYEEKLYNHWVKYGRTEGRTASMYFSAPYYTTRYPDEVKNLADAYEYFITTGFWQGHIGSEYVAMGMDPENLCKHEQTAVALLPSCTDVCKKVTFCAACKSVVHKETSPALSHGDTDGDSLCDRCGKTITVDLLSQNSLLQLPIPVPINELVTDVSAFVKGSSTKPDGIYYMVQKNTDGIYRVLNPLSQSNVGTIAATQVFDVGGKIMGADPDMAAYIYFAPGEAGNTVNTNNYLFRIEESYFLSIYAGSNPLISDRLIRKTSGTNIGVEPNTTKGTIALARTLPDENNDKYYLCLEQRLGMEFFEWSFSKGEREPDDEFYFYRLFEDRLYTESLYAALQRAVSFVPGNALYDNGTHSSLLTTVEEAKSLYEQYNGVSLTGDELPQKEELQSLLDEKERQILDLLGILEINLQGSTVNYFSATMYNWDEDAMNTLVSELEEAETKGFFFEASNTKVGSFSTNPISFYDNDTVETFSGKTTKAQMYSIYSGIAAPDLATATNPPFHNDNVVAADYWSEKAIEGIKQVYTDVRVPFVYKDGYYTMDSDKNGVFFEGEPASGATLAILEKPLSYYWSGGMDYGNRVPGYYANNPYSYRPANGYITAFQPFNAVTATTGGAYAASASVFENTEPIGSYLLDGVAWTSAAEPAVTISGRGTAEWGFGMHLSVNFQMTEDGCLNGDSDQPITFSFSGDDDVWVFIDGKLVMEIGGSHDAIQGEINFVTGNVIISSDKYGRIRDKNENGYGRGDDATQYGENITEVGSILTNQMYQKNIYSDVFQESLAQFAAEGEHTLTVYYMDRGKGRTNCAISFNLPQSDILVVEKDIPEYYGSEDGTLTDKTISDDTMSYLNTLDFGFTLTNGSSYASFREYNIYNEENVLIGTGITDSLGHFTLKNGQSAAFPNLQFNGQTYQVKEDSLNSRWAETKWSGSAAGTVLENTIGVLSPTASVTGDPYGSEVITYVCTNTYIYNPVLIPEEQVVVMDYGKPIDIAVIDNAVFDGISDLVARDGILKEIDLKDSSDANYVTLQKNTVTNRDVRVSLKKMLDKSITLNCTVKITLDDGTVHDNLVIPVTILPATIMYYETDFSADPNAIIFSTDAKPLAEEDKYLWSTRESDGKDDLQDSGEAGDIVYKPVIDKESIPSNAFFVDFDGEGYRDRYSVDPLYNGHDFDSGNWIARYVKNPYVNSGNTLSFPYSASCTYNVSEGTMSLPVTNSYSANSEDITGNTSRIYGSEFHTGTKTDNYSIDTLQYKYSAGDYGEIRFKTEGCVFDPDKNNAESPRAVLRLRYMAYNSEGKLNLQEELVRVPFTFKDGIYQTVSFAIPSEVQNQTIVTIGVRFQHIRQAQEDTPGSVVVDYLYVGPETGWAESVNSNYLYFGFGNTEADRLRYSTAAYGRNFDQPTDAYWATANTGGDTADFTISNTAGTVTIPVSENPDATDSNYGPSIMTTAVPKSYPVKSNNPVEDLAPLRFDTRNADYIQIRFKIENCEWSTDGTHKLIFLYSYLENGTEKFDSADIRIDYSILTDEYQTLRFPVPDGKKLKNAETLTAFGLRFRGIKSMAGQNGTVTIDELFIGSYEALTRLDEGEDFLFFDFTDTDADKVRYSGSTYGGINFGTENWVGTYSWDNELYDPATIENGVLSIPRSQAYDYTYAQSGGSESSRCFRYNPEKAEIFAVRFKMDNTLSVTSKSRIRLDYLTESANGDYVKAAESSLNTETGAYDNYKTIVIDINDETFLTADLIHSIRVDFWYLEGEGSIHIDSIYVGPKAVSNPAADSVYIGFDNMEADRDRYDSDTYNYLNPDDEKTVRWHYNQQKTSSVTVDNKAGTAQVVAVPLEVRNQNKYIDDVFQWPDIYIASSSTGGYSKDYLDYKPQNAEIYQIRFKMKNFQPALNESGGKITPYSKLFWLVSGSESSEEVVTASETIYLTPSQYSGDIWVTLTAKIPEECRNENSIVGIRPYFGGLKSSDNAQGEIVIDYIYIGPDDRPDQVYGYDSHYNNDTTLSDGHSLFVEGSGVKLNENTATYTEASFTFKGTGFDLISRTGPKQATLRIEVWKDGADKAEKRITVNNKGELELYQIPVVSVQGLTYGSYTVKLWVNKAITNSDYDFLNRGGEFYFDAVRIYDPIGNDSTVAYKSDREAYNYIKEIRNILLTKDEFEAISDVTAGAVFVDVNSSNVDPETGEVVSGSTEYYTADVQTYNKIGPKNEVYLAPGQAVAFNLQVSTNQPIASLDIGAKTIVDCSANLEIGILAMDAQKNFTISTRSAYTVQSATAQYQEVDITNVQVKADGEYQPMYVVIYNTSPANSSTDPDTVAKNVISLTDLKVAYKGTPAGEIPEDSLDDSELNKRNTTVEEIPVQLLVDGNTMPAARHFVSAVNETPMLDGDAKIGHSLNLASDIAINYILRKTDLEDYDSFVLECLIPVYEGNTYVGDRLVTLSPVDKGEYWYFTLNGLTAVHMMDEVSAKLVMTAGARTYYSETDTYSIAQYAMAQLQKDKSSATLKALCANLLRYGAEAQTYKGYRTNALADRDLSQEQKTLLTDLSTVAFGNHNSVTKQLEQPSVLWKGKALLLDSKVTLRYAVSIISDAIPIEELSVRVSYTDYQGEEKTVLLTHGQAYGTATGYYTFDFDGLLAAELRTPVYATVYHGDTPVSDTLCYSVDSYGKNKPDPLNSLCRALLAYSDCAKAYFGG